MQKEIRDLSLGVSLLLLLVMTGNSLAKEKASAEADKVKDAPVVTSESDKEVYFLYGDARPGTKFKQKLYKSNVPFDVRYKDMSPTLKARVKDSYGGLKESETPPFPTEGMQAIYRPLFKANRDMAEEGDVLAIALVDSMGNVKSVSMYKTPASEVSSIVNYILVNTKFDPATCDGAPCEMEFLFETRIETKPAWTR